MRIGPRAEFTLFVSPFKIQNEVQLFWICPSTPPPFHGLFFFCCERSAAPDNCGIASCSRYQLIRILTQMSVVSTVHEDTLYPKIGSRGHGNLAKSFRRGIIQPSTQIEPN